MKIVAVTGCATGLAHTHDVAEQLERTARSLGHHIKVETQGAMGIENELNRADIQQADFVIFAADIAIEQFERFVNRRQLHVSAQDAIKNPRGIFASLR